MYRNRSRYVEQQHLDGLHPVSGRAVELRPDFTGWFGGGRRGRGGPFRGGRMFEQGDLKYVILQLLDEKPRHGYEIIKALEDRFGGMYSPSAGTVYPTLTLLEDLGYARVNVEEGGKKVYSITDEGKRTSRRTSRPWTTFSSASRRSARRSSSDGMMEVNRAIKDVAQATYRGAPRIFRDKEAVAGIRESLQRAAREIEEIVRASA
jgi:DNA-binding PadR family transcriptional regulator